MELGAKIIVFFFILVFVKFFGNNVMNKIASLFSDNFLGLFLKKISFIVGNIDNIVLVMIFFFVCIVGIVLFNVKIRNIPENKVIEKHTISISDSREPQGYSNFESFKEENKNDMKALFDIDLDRKMTAPDFENFCDPKHKEEMVSGELIQNKDKGNVYDKNYTLV